MYLNDMLKRKLYLKDTRKRIEWKIIEKKTEIVI